MDIREELNLINKADLIDVIIELCDNGYYPWELFLLRGPSAVNSLELENYWNAIYENARMKEEVDSDLAADILRTGAELCFKKAKMFSNEEDTRKFCQMMVADLHDAAESDGIGMESDSEWIYLDYADQLEAY